MNLKYFGWMVVVVALFYQGAFDIFSSANTSEPDARAYAGILALVLLFGFSVGRTGLSLHKSPFVIFTTVVVSYAIVVAVMFHSETLMGFVLGETGPIYTWGAFWLCTLVAQVLGTMLLKSITRPPDFSSYLWTAVTVTVCVITATAITLAGYIAISGAAGFVVLLSMPKVQEGLAENVTPIRERRDAA